MARIPRLPSTLGVLGVALVAIGVAVGGPDVEIEGAYFDRSVDADAGAAVFSEVGPGLLSFSDGNLWLGAGIALIAVAIGAAASSRLSGVRRALAGRR